MRMTTMTGALTALLATAAPMAAQPPVALDAGTPRVNFGLGGLVAQPVGEFADYVNVGFGLGANMRLNLDPAGITSLRVDLGFINYGNQTRDVCLGGGAGCLIRLDLTTSNNILLAHGGLQLMVPSGPVRPYVNGGIGYGYFATESRVRGRNNAEDFASTTNFDDGAFSWLAGGGLHVPLSTGRTRINLDVGANYTRNNEVEYLTKGDISTRPDGSVILDPKRSRVDLVRYFVGVSVAVRGGQS